MDYTVVECDEVSGLIQVVKDLIKQGWIPAGGIAACVMPAYENRGETEGPFCRYAQAMVKTE
jgi:hypothetical protein